MGAKSVHFLGMFLAVLCMLVTGFSEGNHKIAKEDSSHDNGHWNFEEIDENTAEQVWIHCRKELEEITKNSNFYTNDNKKISRKTLVHNAITNLPPQLKQSLFLSLKSKRFPSRVNCKDGCQEFVYKLYIHNIHPRKSFKRKRARPHGSLGPARKQASRAALEKEVDKSEFRVSIKAEQKPADHLILIGIIVSTAIATLCLFVLLVFCCVGGEKQKVGTECAEKDEKPVVNIGPGTPTTQPVEANKDPINSLNTTNSFINPSSQPPEIGNLPLPPGKTLPPPPSAPPPPPAPAPTAPPPPPPGPKAPPPPPPGGGRRPPNPPKPGNKKAAGSSTSKQENDPSGGSNNNKAKLKPLFWDKMNMNPDQSMVWNEIKAGSFQFDEEMMASLFGYGSTQNKGKGEGVKSSNLNSQPKLIQIIDPRKAQNLAITLKALSVTTEKACYALKEGTDLPVELIETLIKMPPSQEEELKLRLYNGDLALLGPAERFLKFVIEIPFVFKRLEALLFMSSFHEDSTPLKQAFLTLEVACTKLKNSRLFLKLLEAVLKTGNRMNVGTYRGGAQAIKLDTLLKLSDVKGTDGKTTLLTFVVQEIIRSEGHKAARNRNKNKNVEENEESLEYHRKLGLEVVSHLNKELDDVKKAAVIDGDHITSTVLKLSNMMKKTKDLIMDELNTSEEAREFCSAFNDFMENAEKEILWMLEEEKRIMALVKSTGDYFHGNSAKDEGLRLFVIVNSFLKLLDKVCVEIKKTIQVNIKKKEAVNQTAVGKKETLKESSSGRAWPSIRDKLFPALKDRKMDYSSSSSSSSSDDEDF